MLTDDSGSDKTEPGTADGTESNLGTDGLSEKFGKSSVGSVADINSPAVILCFILLSSHQMYFSILYMLY